LLDELEKRTRTYTEKLDQYADELSELQSTNSQMIMSNDALIASNEEVAKAIDKPISKIEQLRIEAKAASDQAAILASTGGQMGTALSIVFENVGRGIEDLTNRAVQTQGVFGRTIDYLYNKLTDLSVATYKGINNFTSGFIGPQRPPEYKDGGIIPGSPSTPVPIIAHGGETVLPAGVQPVTININNPSVRNDADIQRIAKAVNDILSTQQKFRQVK